ncbi:MAG: RNA polymerase sigma factor [Deltaproteobacteria bacterium]|nr:RNA polymerase sigma factor [Deltaproteobacteria bacterium]
MDLRATTADTANSDRELAARLRRGDPQALTALWVRYHGRIHGFLLRLCRQPALAEDLLQEVFIRLARHGPELAADAPLLPWLYTVARNLYRSEQRKQVGWLQRLPWAQRHFDVPSPTPYTQAVAADRERRVEAALLDLPDAYREALLLVAVEQLTPASAAQVLGISDVALRKRVSRARVMLRQALSEAEEGDP